MFASSTSTSRLITRGAMLPLVFAVFAATGCEQEDTAELRQRIEQLENEVQTQEDKIETVALATAVGSASVFDSPLQQFFAAPEFWEVVYEDEGACHNRCYAAYQSAMDSCAGLETEEEIDACKLDAASETVACHEACRPSP